MVACPAGRLNVELSVSVAGKVVECWEVDSVEYSSSWGFEEDSVVRGETVSWLEFGLGSVFKSIAKPAADNSKMMRKRRIMIIGLGVFASLNHPSVSSSLLLSTSVSSSFLPTCPSLSSFCFSSSKDGIRKLVKDLSTHLDINMLYVEKIFLFRPKVLTYFKTKEFLAVSSLPEITAPVVRISIISW